MSQILEVNKISKAFDGNQVLDDISFVVNKEEVFAILGPSGCGKSTILNIIAGIELPDQGTISFSGKEVTTLPIHQRKFGMVFQDYALFPHMNVADNVTFGLKMQRRSNEYIEKRLQEVLEVVDLGGYQKRDVTSLSGGERQRVAFARTLAAEPDLIMLDEPLGSLDRKLRDVLLERLGTILARTEVPAIYVTHDPYEALVISDRIAIMKDGQFIEINTPAQLFLNPKTDYTANFIGIENIFGGEIIQKNGEALLKSDLGTFSYPTDRDGKVQFIIKPGYLTTQARSDRDHKIDGIVEESMFTGHDFEVDLNIGQRVITAHLKPTDVDPLTPGERLSVYFTPEAAIHIFDKLIE